MEKIMYEVMKAPPPKRARTTRGSELRDLFDSMEVGEWMSVKAQDKSRMQAAASYHLKGRYSMYKTDDGDYALIKK